MTAVGVERSDTVQHRQRLGSAGLAARGLQDGEVFIDVSILAVGGWSS
jgi:hypothetical protein